MFLSSFGGSETKKLIQNLSFEFIPQSGWYNTHLHHCKFLHGDDDHTGREELKNSQITLPLMPNVKELELIMNVPSSVKLCKHHSDQLKETYKLISSSHIETQHRNICSPGISEIIHEELVGSVFGEAQAILEDLKSKTRVRVEWRIFEWNNKSDRCDWDCYSVLRLIHDHSKDSYKRKEREEWLNTLGGSKIS